MGVPEEYPHTSRHSPDTPIQLSWDFAPESNAETYWQDDDLLVVQDGAILPDRCVQCNSPSHGRHLNLYFESSPPWFYNLILPGVASLLLSAVYDRNEISCQVGICHYHARRPGNSALLAVYLGTASLVPVFLGLLFEIPSLLILFPVIVIVAGITLIRGNRMLRAMKVDDDYAWLKGACPEYLSELPHF